jgi:hypothetical protein
MSSIAHLSLDFIDGMNPEQIASPASEPAISGQEIPWLLQAARAAKQSFDAGRRLRARWS